MRFYTLELLFRNSLPLHLSPIFKVNLRRGSLAKRDPSKKLLRRINPLLDTWNMQVLPRTHLSTTFEWAEGLTSTGSQTCPVPTALGRAWPQALGIPRSGIDRKCRFTSETSFPDPELRFDRIRKHSPGFPQTQGCLSEAQSTDRNFIPAGPPDIYEYHRSIFHFGFMGFGCQLSTCHHVSSA